MASGTGSVLKNYVIKITADIDDAKNEIKKLTDSFSFENKNSLDVEKQIQRITGAVDRLKQEFSGMSKLFDTKQVGNFGKEIIDSVKEVNRAINEMKDSFKGFSDIYSSLSGDQKLDLGQGFKDFSDQMKEMMLSYKDTMSVINDLISGATSVTALKGAAGRGMINNIKQQTKLTEEALNEAKNRIESAVNRYQEATGAISQAADIGKYKDQQGKEKKYTKEQMRDYLQRVSQILSVAEEYKNTEGIDLQDLIFSRLGGKTKTGKDIGLSRQTLIDLKEMLETRIGDAVKYAQNAANENLKTSGVEEQKINVTLGVTLDPSSIDANAISKIVSTINDQISSKVQESVEPIKIPIRVENAVEPDTKSGEKDLMDKDGQKGIIKELKFQVNADKKQIIDQINSVIKEINNADNLEKVKIHAMVDVDEKSATEAAHNITNALEEHNEKRGVSGVNLFSGGTFNIGDIGNLATEGTLQSILGTVQAIATGGLHLDPKSFDAFSSKVQPSSVQNGSNANDDIVLKEYKRQLSYGGRSRQLTEEVKDQLRTQEELSTLLAFEENRSQELNEFKKYVGRKGKGLEDLRKSKLYLESYKDESGIERALYGNGETIGIWQKKLEQYLAVYQNALDHALNGPTVRDEKGNIIEEGTRTQYKRIKDEDTDVEFMGKTMKAWQKVIIEDNNRARELELKKDSAARTEAKKSTEQIDLLRKANPKMTIEDAVTQIINDKWAAINEKVLKSSTMTDELEEEYKRIANNAANRTRAEAFRSQDVLPKEMQELAFAMPLSSAIGLSEKRVKSLNDSLRPNRTEVNKQTGEVYFIQPNMLESTNEKQGVMELNRILDQVAEDQVPALAAAKAVEASAKKDLDNITEFISLYGKFVDGASMEDDEISRLADLEVQMSKNAYRYTATGEERKRLDAAKATMDRYMKDSEAARFSGKELSQERKDEYLEAFKVWNDTQDATLEQIFEYAVAHEPKAKQIYESSKRDVKKIKSKTRDAAQQIAESNEYLAPALQGRDKYDQRQKKLSGYMEELTTLREKMGFHDETGTYDESTLTKPEKSRYDWLRKEVNLLETQQTLYRKLNEEESASQKTGEKKLTGMHLQEETAKALAKVQDESSDLTSKSSDELFEMAKVYEDAAKQQSDYLSSQSASASDQAKLMVAKDIDDARASVRELDKAIKEAEKSGEDQYKITSLKRQRDQKQMIVNELTSTTDEDADIAKKLAENQIKRERINAELQKMKSTEQYSDKDIEPLQKQIDDSYKDDKQLRAQSGAKRSDIAKTVQENVVAMASDRIKEIDDTIGAIPVDDFAKELGIKSLKDLPKLSEIAEEASDSYQTLVDKFGTEDSIKQQIESIREKTKKYDEQKKGLEKIAESLEKDPQATKEQKEDISKKLEQNQTILSNRDKQIGRLQNNLSKLEKARSEMTDRQTNLDMIRRNYKDDPQLKAVEEMIEERKFLSEIVDRSRQSLVELSKQEQDRGVEPGTILDARKKIYEGRINADIQQTEAWKAENEATAQMLKERAEQAKEQEELAEKNRKEIEAAQKAAEEEATRRSKMSIAQRIKEIEDKYVKKESDLLSQREEKSSQARQHETDKTVDNIFANNGVEAAQKQLDEINAQLEQRVGELNTTTPKSLQSLLDSMTDDKTGDKVLQGLIKQKQATSVLLEDAVKDIEDTDLYNQYKIAASTIRRRLSEMSKFNPNKGYLQEFLKKYESGMQTGGDWETKRENAFISQRQLSSEIQDLDQQIKNRQNEQLQNILTNYETQIRDVQQQLIHAVAANSPENIITELRNKLLGLYDQYKEYGGKKAFSKPGTRVRLGELNEDVRREVERIERKIIVKKGGVKDLSALSPDELRTYRNMQQQVLFKGRRGYIGDKTALQWAKDYVPQSLQTLQEQKISLEKQVKDAEKTQSGVKSKGDTISQQLSSELNSIDASIANLVTDRVKEVSNMYMEQIEKSTSKRSALSYKKKMLDYQRQAILGDSTIKDVESEIAQLTSEREGLSGSRKKKDKQRIIDINDRITELQSNLNVLNTIQTQYSQMVDDAIYRIENGIQEETKADTSGKPQLRKVGKKVIEEFPEFASKTEDEIFESIQQLTDLRKSLEDKKSDIQARMVEQEKVKNIISGKFSDERKKLMQGPKARTKAERELVGQTQSAIESGDLDKAREFIANGGISDKRIKILNKMIEIKDQLLQQEKMIEEVSNQEADVNTELSDTNTKLTRARNALMKRQNGAAPQSSKRDLLLEQYREETKDNYKKYKTNPSDPWRAWYYAEMSEEEAVISRRIHDLAKKAYKGTAEEAEKLELAELHKKAEEFGLTITDKGYVQPKVDYEEFMANSSKYIIPKISTEMAQKYGFGATGTTAGTTQPVSISEPVNVNSVGNVGTVGIVTNVNLGTIEGLLASIAAKIGADTSGIKIGENRQPQQKTTKYDYTNKSKDDLNAILADKKSTQDQIDAAAMEALRRGRSLFQDGDGKYRIRRKNNKESQIKTVDDYYKSRGITPPPKSQTVAGDDEGNKPEKERTTSEQNTKQSKSERSKYRSFLNESLDSKKVLNQDERDAIIKEAFEAGYALSPKIDKSGNAIKDQYSIVKKKNASIKTYEDYLNQRGDITTEESYLKALASRGNDMLYAASSKDERDKIRQEFVRHGLKLGSNGSDKIDKLFLTSGVNADDIATAGFIKDNGIEVKVDINWTPDDKFLQNIRDKGTAARAEKAESDKKEKQPSKGTSKQEEKKQTPMQPKQQPKEQPKEQPKQKSNKYGLITEPGSDVAMKWYRTVQDTLTGLLSNRYNGGSFSSNNLKLSKSYANKAREQGTPTKTYEQTMYLTDKILEIKESEGESWATLQHLGNGIDEDSKEITQLFNTISTSKERFDDIEARFNEGLNLDEDQIIDYMGGINIKSFIGAIDMLDNFKEMSNEELSERIQELTTMEQWELDEDDPRMFYDPEQIIEMAGLKYYKPTGADDYEAMGKRQSERLAMLQEAKKRGLNVEGSTYDDIGDMSQFFDDFLNTFLSKEDLQYIQSVLSAAKRIREINSDVNNLYGATLPPHLVDDRKTNPNENSNYLTTNKMTEKAAAKGLDAVIFRQISDSASHAESNILSDIISVINSDIIASANVLSDEELLSDGNKIMRQFTGNSSAVEEIIQKYIGNIFDGIEGANEAFFNYINSDQPVNPDVLFDSLKSYVASMQNEDLLNILSQENFEKNGHNFTRNIMNNIAARSSYFDGADLPEGGYQQIQSNILGVIQSILNDVLKLDAVSGTAQSNIPFEETGQAGEQAGDKAASGMDHIEQEAQDATVAVIDLGNALKSIAEIYSSSGREGLLSALGNLSREQLHGIAEEAGYKNSRGNLAKSNSKSIKEWSNFIADNYEKSIPQVASITGEQLSNSMFARLFPNGSRGKENYDFNYDEAAIKTALLPFIKVKENKQLSVDNFKFEDVFDKLPEEIQGTHFDILSSENLQRIMAITKSKFSEIGDLIVKYYNDDISFNELVQGTKGVIDESLKLKKDVKKQEGNRGVDQKSGQSDGDSGVKSNTEVLRENEAAADDAADSHRRLNQEMNQPSAGDSGIDQNTEDVKENEKAIEDAIIAHQKFEEAKVAITAKDSDDNFIKPMIQNWEDARNIIRAIKDDENFQFGNLVDFKATENGFRYRDELNDFIYRFSKKNGSMLRETPEVSKELSALEKLEERIDSTLQRSQVSDIYKYQSNMFADTGARQKIEEAQQIIEQLRLLQTIGLRDEDGLSIINTDGIQEQQNQIDRLLELIREVRRQNVGEELVVGKSTGGLATARADLQAYFDSLDRGNASIVRFNNSNTQMTYTLRTADDMIETHTVSINKFGEVIDQLNSTQKYLSPLQKMIGGLGAKFGELFRYMVASTSIYRVIGSLKQAVGVVKEYDTALTEMRKVSDESLASLKAFQSESFGMANQVGTTALKLQQSTADWMRLGESLDEAKRSAQETTILLNVSEFSSVDEATESLVAMSQAYKDLDKIDIIDKLNNIGNNFSISTSELAKSLQKSAGTLKVTGDTLDEAIALTVAANQTLQNPDIVGQSLKTMSLRLSGTSIADMQEAGEEIDGLISTTSKLRQKILDATKVKSNQYKGFDIVNDDGSYKTTYERLLGIAKVFKEIGEEDKRLGTNRQSFLLETIAGKTRAAAASSILENPEILEKVYKSVANSEGSAQQELDKYLDSIQGKLDRLSNKMQELANITINSDSLKVILDLVNAIMTGVNGAAKAFGTLKLAIGAIAAMSMKKIGAGFVDYDKSKGFQFGNIFKGSQQPREKDYSKLGFFERFFGKRDLKKVYEQGKQDASDTVQNDEGRPVNIPVAPVVDTKASENVAKSDIVEPIVEAVEGADVGKQVGDAVSESMENADVEFDSSDYYGEYTEGVEQAVEATEQIAPAAQQAAESMQNVGQAARASGAAANEMSKQIQQGVSAISMLKNIGATFVSMMANMAIAMAASWAVEQLVKGIYNIANAEKIAIDKGRQAQQTITELKDAFDEKDAFSNENLKEYLKLREETSVTKEGGLQNVSLDGASYEKFLSLNKEIAELFPSLVSTYDANGNALLTLSSNADTATDSLKALVEQERMMTEYEIGENLPAVATSAAIQIANATEEMDKYAQRADDIRGIQQILNGNIGEDFNFDALNLEGFGVSEDLRMFSKKFDITDTSTREYVYNLAKIYEDAWREAGVTLNNTAKQETLYDQDTGEYIQEETYQLMMNMVPDETQIKKFKQEYSSRLAEFSKHDLPEDLVESIVKANAADSEIKATWNSLVPSLISQMSLYDDYRKLGDSSIGAQLQQIISDDISNMDYMSLKDSDKKRFKTETREFLRERYLDPIIDAAKDNKGNIQEEVLKQITDTISGTDISRNQWRDNIIRLSQDLFDGDVVAAKNFRIAIGVQYETKDGRLVWSDDEGVSNLSEITNIPKGMLNQLNKEDLDLAFKATLTGQFDFEGTTLEELQQWIDKYRDIIEKSKEASSDGTLGQIFADETYSSAAEDYEKRLSSLSSALETLRTDGQLTAEQMRDLQEEFSDMTDFSKESISDVALKELGSWIGEFKKNLDTLSPKGLEQVTTYVNNLAASYGDLDVSEKDAILALKTTIKESLKEKGLAGEIFRQTASGLEDEAMIKIEDLKSKYGDDLNWQVVWELIMMDRFSDQAADIEAEYSEREYWWQIHIDYKNAIADIEKVNERVNAEISAEEARNADKTARGKILTRSDYDKIVADKGILKKNAWDELILAKNTDDGSEQAMIEIANKRAAYYQARADEAEAIKQQEETILNETNKRIEKSQLDAANAQREIDQKSANGIFANQSIYNKLADAQEAEAQAQRDLADGYMELANNPELAEFSDEYLKSATEALSSAIELDKNARETRYQPEVNQITALQNAYTNLQTEASKTEETLNSADMKRKKTTDVMYNSLISNGKEQIANLKEQREHYINLRRAAEKSLDLDSLRNYQSEINNINSSIVSMENDIIGWSDTMNSLVSTNAAQLSSTISSAFSEMNSETGLTIDTMNELERQFSDLSNVDIATLFYHSSNGMKLNVGAAEELVDAEYKLQQAQLDSIITQQQKILADDNATASAKRNAQERINEAQRELSMLQALYDQQKQQFSNFAKWQNAQSTDNAGSNYESLQGYLKTQKENYEKGLTGTDEFRAYTEYYDRWGRDTVDAWEDVKSKVERYMTEDSSGLKHFMDDLVANGFAEAGENGGYLINMPSVEEAAKTMGMNVEWMRDLLGRSEDYGFTNNWVESELDGQKKIEEETHKLIEAQEKYNQAVTDGASQDVLDDLQSVIDVHKNNIDGLAQGIKDVTAHEGEISRSQIELARDNIESFQKLISEQKENGTLTDEMKKSFESEMQRWADQNYIQLKVNAETGELEIDEDAFKESFPEFEVKDIIKPDWSQLDDQYADTATQMENNWDDNTDALGGYLDELNSLGLTFDELNELQLDNGGYDHEDNENLVKAEQTLDKIKTTLGLNAEQAQHLVEILQQLGLLKPVDDEYLNTPTKEKKKLETPAIVGTEETKEELRSLRPQPQDVILANARKNAQEKIEQERYASEQKPTTDAVNEVNSSLATHTGEIVSAIEGLPDNIASALAGYELKAREYDNNRPIDKSSGAGYEAKVREYDNNRPINKNAGAGYEASVREYENEHPNTLKGLLANKSKQIFDVIIDSLTYDQGEFSDVIGQPVKEAESTGQKLHEGLTEYLKPKLKSAVDNIAQTISPDGFDKVLNETIPTFVSNEIDAWSSAIDNAKSAAKEGVTDDTPILRAGLAGSLDHMISESLSSMSIIDFIDEGDIAAPTAEFGNMLSEQIQHMADGVTESGEKIEIEIPLSNILVSFVDDSNVTSDAYGFDSMMNEQIQHMADGVTGSVPLETSGEAKEVQVNYTGNQGEINTVVSQDVASGQMTADGNPIEPQYESGNGLVNMVVDAITSASSVAEENPIEINFTGGESTAEPQTDPVVTPQVDNAEYDSAMSSAIESADELDSKKPTPTANLNTNPFDSGASHVESTTSSLNALTAMPTIDANIDPALAKFNTVIQEAARAAAAVASVGSGGGGGSSGGSSGGGQAYGTAQASGTALAHGNWGLKKPGETLVGELGQEMYVDPQTAEYKTIGDNGPEFVDLPKNAIVFNHRQTAELLKKGHTNRRGKALAGGTQSITGPAALTIEGAGQTGANSVRNSGSIQPSSNPVPWVKDFGKATDQATDSTKAATAAKDKETDATEKATTALDKFSQYVGSLYDWIEVKIKRWTHKMELAISRAENIGGIGLNGKQNAYRTSSGKELTGFEGKNAYIDKAMAANEKLYNTNVAGEKRYKKQAGTIMKKAKKLGLVNSKQAKKYTELIQNGAISIEELESVFKKNTKGQDTSKSESKIKTVIDAYTTW